MENGLKSNSREQTVQNIKLYNNEIEVLFMSQKKPFELTNYYFAVALIWIPFCGFPYS